MPYSPERVREKAVNKKNNQKISTGQGGARPGAGRKKGIPNKRTQEQVESVKATGMTPLEYLTSVYQSPLPPELTEAVEKNKLDADVIQAIAGWHARRIDAAKAAAPFVHPKLVSMHSTDNNKKQSFREWVEEQEASVKNS